MRAVVTYSALCCTAANPVRLTRLTETESGRLEQREREREGGSGNLTIRRRYWISRLKIHANKDREHDWPVEFFGAFPRVVSR